MTVRGTFCLIFKLTHINQWLKPLGFVLATGLLPLARTGEIGKVYLNFPNNDNRKFSNVKKDETRTTAEATVVRKLPQGTVQGMGCLHSLLEFSLFLYFFQEKEGKMTELRTSYQS